MESRSAMAEIPGLFSSETQQQSTPFEGMDNTAGSENNRLFLMSGRSLLEALLAEKERLDPNLTFCNKLLDKEIASVQSGEKNPRLKQTEKIFIPLEDQKRYNVIGRLLGPKGLTLKRMQSETQTKMSILGRGSIKDKKKEEELRNSDIPAHAHLKEDLHILVDAEPPNSLQKLAAGVAEVKKMLVPLEPGQPDLIAAKYLDQAPIGLEGYSGGGKMGMPGGPPGPQSPYGMRGGGDRNGPPRRGGGGGPRGRGGRGGRGGGPRRDSEGRGGGPERSMRGGGWESSERSSGRGRGPLLEGGFGAGKKNMRREEQSSHSDSRPYGGSSGGPSADRELGGFNGRRSSFGPDTSYARMDRFNDDSDQYYSNFSDPPRSPVSRDYNHGTGGSEWKATRPGRREFRHHPYQQSSGNFY